MTDQYAKNERWVFRFDLSEDEYLLVLPAQDAHQELDVVWVVLTVIWEASKE